jgi:AraC-like DNA-binding protein
VRTLQRRLAETGVSYTDLVQHTRFEAAAKMLGNPATQILDISNELGYEDPSNFARAFQRIAGVRPNEYRKNHYIM